MKKKHALYKNLCLHFCLYRLRTSHPLSFHVWLQTTSWYSPCLWLKSDNMLVYPARRSGCFVYGDIFPCQREYICERLEVGFLNLFSWVLQHYCAVILKSNCFLWHVKVVRIVLESQSLLLICDCELLVLKLIELL